MGPSQLTESLDIQSNIEAFSFAAYRLPSAVEHKWNTNGRYSVICLSNQQVG